MREEASERQPLDVPVTVTLGEAYAGATRLVQIPPDPRSGEPGRRLEVTIPAGVQSGSRVHVGRAEADRSPVDLYLSITVSPHPAFERRGDDLLTTVGVRLVDAVLGGEVEVPTITGTKVALRVPPETQNSRVFRLKGKGMPKKRGTDGATHGDLLATVRVVLPAGLSEEQRTLFQRLRELGGPAGPLGEG